MVMPIEDVYGIIDATSNLKHRALLMTTYTAGLRVSEVAVLGGHVDQCDSCNYLKVL